jgi:acetyltransferase
MQTARRELRNVSHHLTLEVAQQNTPTSIRPVSPTELESHLPAFVELLRDTVNGGVPMGFLPPLTHDEGRDYWLSLRPELQAGSRLLLAAYTEDGIVGSGQLSLSSWPSSPHRAELQKLFVATALRGRGLGRSLLTALHDTARQHGRSLLHLNTRRGEPAEVFYKGLGYREVGVIPGWTVGRAGERYDHVTLYQELSL